MYGLLLESFRQYICTNFTEAKWDEIVKRSEMDSSTFNIHTIYPESFLPRVVENASLTLSKSVDDIMYENGVYFIDFLTQYGYDGVLKVLGRDLRDFLNGLDNLHEYMRFRWDCCKLLVNYFTNAWITVVIVTDRKKLRITLIKTVYGISRFMFLFKGIWYWILIF